MINESMAGGLVVGGFNKAHLELDLKINRLSGVKHYSKLLQIDCCDRLTYHKLQQNPITNWGS